VSHDSGPNDIHVTSAGPTTGPWLFGGALAEGDGRQAEAAEIYRSVAGNGDPRGDTALGVLLDRSPESNPVDALAALSRGADGGDVAAFAYLGDVVWAGRGVAAEPARALDLFERGAQLGDARAARRAGDLLASGHLATTEPARAEAGWRRAVELGQDPAAMLALAESAIAREAFLDGISWAIQVAHRTRALLFETSGDRRWTPDHDEAGNRRRLARQLETAIDLVNHHRVELYAATNAGDAEACWLRGRIVALGFGEDPDPAEGRAWMEQAAASGHPEALHSSAQSARRDGDLVAFEVKLRAAADLGFPAAVHDLGFALYSGAFGGEEDHDGAIEMYRSIAGPDRPSTATDLSFVLEDVAGAAAAAESLHWLRVAADAGEVPALRRLGERLRDGDAVDADPVAAARAYLTAFYLGWEDGVAAVAAFVDELAPLDVIAADRAADGSGLAASLLLDASASVAS
jgi:TPR repeat protein